MPAILSSRLKNYFTNSSRTRGAEYFVEGRISIDQGSASSVDAHVDGTEVYDVRLNLRDDVLAASCDCPYFKNFGTFCKHVWGTLLAAQQHKHLSAAVSAKDLRMRFVSNGT